ncbi:hypothetical protein [Hyphomicrobium sp.]|uniref:hypothetical protein n=1 Tax=Hyphomicrobium sp. TaxID=82 RepID=UPI002FDE7064
MSRATIVLALLAASALPASAGAEWYGDGYYETHSWTEYRTYHTRPYRAPAYEVYIPYGAYFSDGPDEPDDVGATCEVEREWSRGGYREEIECNGD